MGSPNDHGGDRDEKDAAIAGALRKAVAASFRDDRDAVTLRLIRTIVEKELGLVAEFFKNNSHWKDRSKAIVMEEVEIQSANNPEPATQENPPSDKKKKPSRKPAAKPRAKKAVNPVLGEGKKEEGQEEEDVAPQARKRGATKPTAEKKKPAAKRTKAKVDITVEDEKDDEEDAPKSKPISGDMDDSELSDLLDDFHDVQPKKRARKSGTKQASSNKKIKSSPEASPQATPKSSHKAAKIVPGMEEERGQVIDEQPIAAVGGQSGDESEMSIVFDEPPVSKNKSRSRSAITTSDTKKKPKKGGTVSKDLPPDEEKIKSLQGWLLKCGVRKFWSRELAKFDTPKAKIQHLKGLLEDVGMTGQYSIAKAKKIKEDRELAAEVEWVQQGATDWGKESEEGLTTRAGKASTTATSGRKLTQKSRGFDGLDFLGDQSEDSD